MSPIALRKQLSKWGTLLAAGKLAESSGGGWEVLSEAQKMDGACLYIEADAQLKSCPLQLAFLQRWHWQMSISMFLFEKENKKKQGENLFLPPN